MDVIKPYFNFYIWWFRILNFVAFASDSDKTVLFTCIVLAWLAGHVLDFLFDLDNDLFEQVYNDIAQYGRIHLG